MLLFILAITLFFVSIWNFFSYLNDIKERKALFIVKIKATRRQCMGNL